jgi:hypothetical protein
VQLRLAQSEVANLGRPLSSQHDIFWLEVAMDNAVLV